MTDRNKFEQMLEHLINEESDKAKELFHQLVVEKSREIYENILAEDFEDLDEEKDEDDEMDEAKKDDDEDQVDESDDSDDEEMDESFGFAEGDDEEDSGDIGGDAADDFIDDVDAEGGDEEGSEGEGDLEDRVVDLEDALDDLRSEFEALMSDEEGGDMGGMDDMGGDMGGMDDMGGDMEDEPKLENDVDAFMREYVEKVGNPKHGDNGANTKSIMAKANNMGGTTANIVKGGESTTGGTKGGLLNPSTKEENFGNINVPGGNAGKTAFKKKEAGHGAEKKATGDNGDRGADSPINGVKSRSK
jgi:hypothetical protein